jgi:hypothetical protein
MPEDQKNTENAQVNTWLKRIEASRNLREKIASDFSWKDIIDEFHGKYNWAKWGLTDIYIPPLNLSFAYVETEMPALSLRNPHFKVNPKNEQSINAAKIMEKALNYIWRTKRVKRENTKNILDGLLVGHAWFKTGYSGQFGVAEDSSGNKYEFIEKEDFFGYRLPWDCVYFNPDALDPPYDCTWIAHEIWTTKEGLVANPVYNPEAVKRVQYGTRKKAGKESNGSVDYSLETQSNESNVCCLYEIWDKSTMTKFTISPGVGQFLEAPKPWPYEMRGFPFSYLCFNPSPSFPYGIPDVYTFRAQIIELIKVYAMMLDHLKRFNRQLYVKGTPLSADHLNQLLTGATGVVLNGIPQDSEIGAVVYPPLQADIYAIERLLKEMIIVISGQSAQEKGGSQVTTTRTVSELEMMKQGNVNRRSRKVDLVEDFITDIAENFVALFQQFADIPFYVRLTGEEYQAVEEALASRPSANMQGSVTGPSGFTFTKEDIQGEFDLVVVPGSTTPLDRPATMQTLLQLIPELQQFGIRPGGPVAGAIGGIIAENLEMPEINRALKAEAEANAKSQEKQAQDQQAAQGLMVSEKTSKINIDATNAATKQNKVLGDYIKTIIQADIAKEQLKKDKGEKK